MYCAEQAVCTFLCRSNSTLEPFKTAKHLVKTSVKQGVATAAAALPSSLAIEDDDVAVFEMGSENYPNNANLKYQSKFS